MRNQQDMAIERCVGTIDHLTRLVVGGEIRRLPDVLQPGEELLKVVSAIVPGGWGLLVATGDRVLWVDEGLVSFRADTLEYNRITSVLMHAGLVGGTILFNMYGHNRLFSFVRPNSEVFPFGNLVLEMLEQAGGGGEESRSRGGGASLDPAGDDVSTIQTESGAGDPS